MKKITRLSIFTVALMTLASSCNRDEAGLNPPEQKYGTVTITADAARTRTVLDGGAVKWEDGDEIALRFTHDTKETVVGKFATSIEAGSAATADFTGTVALDVLREDGGYDNAVHAVYPYDALTGEGVVFALPASQQARENGAFAERLNLASAALSLADIRDDGKASGTFLNALSILRFRVTGNDVTSVTLTGTAPLAGTAPVVFADGGRLVIDADADWADADKDMSVTLTPADGSDCFAEGTEYNLLVWPGTHGSLTATLNFKEYGAFDKTSAAEFTFEPSKYYTLDFNADSETLVQEIVSASDDLEGRLDELESQLAALETVAEKISLLVDQIQSVALMTEYLDNAVYAPYAKTSMNKMFKKPIALDYTVRPAKAMELLLEVCAEEGNLSEVLSAKVDYKTGGLHDLTVTDAALEGDVLTVTVDAGSIWNDFYNGTYAASVALEIADGNTGTDILSDFANLVSKQSLVMVVANNNNLPAMRSAGMSFGFEFGAANANAVTAKIEDVKGFASAPSVRLVNASNTGYVSMSFKENDKPEEMGFKVVLSDDNETESVEFTFEDVGELVLDYTSEIGYVGGAAFVTAVLPQNNYTYVAPSMSMRNYQTQILYHTATSQYDHDRIYYYDWAYETVQGVPGSYTVEPNTVKTADVENPKYKKYNSITQEWEFVEGEPEYLTLTLNTGEKDRSFYVDVSVETATVPKYTYTKTATITQKQNGTAIDESMYYQNGDVIILQEADPKYATPLNIVILGDGYQKKDLQKGGKFMRSARSACDAFFGVAPFSHFRDRFNVYMVAYESVDEGIDILSQNLNKDTYFEAYWDGNSTAAWVTDSGRDKVINVVKNTLGLDTDAEYYRTIALVLSNVDAVAGSCGYPYRDLYSNTSVVGEDYASFAIAVLPANSTATGSLIRHELGGHGFGRLGDEYETETYGSDLDTWHTKGFYRNVTTNKDSWNWNAFIGLQGYENVDYIWRNDNYWCPSDGGIMYNNNGTFNPPCRQIIYERIIRQTEGYNAYSWEKFLEYDKQNIQ